MLIEGLHCLNENLTSNIDSKDKKGYRKLTPRECARFQGFPEDYKLPNIANSALYKQMGNSVSVPVITAIGKEIMKAIKKVG